MSNVPSVFSLQQITLTAAIAAVVSLGVMLFLHRRSETISLSERIVIAVVVGVSVFAWRLAGNVAPLNDDPIPPFSPNDLLCPVVTYVLLGLYAAVRLPTDVAHWEKTRALLTLVSFVTNVLFI